MHKAAARVTTAMEEIGDRVQELFGARVNVLLADSPREELQKTRRPGSRLWRQILLRGIPILELQAEAAKG